MTPGFAWALQPTQQQIQMFNNLPQAEKERLAAQLGVEVPVQSPETSSDVVAPVSTVQPRPESQRATSNQSVAEAQDPILEPFGYELFAGNPSSFTPVNDVPVSSDYILGPGDSLNVDVYGKENNSYELTIDSEGKVYIPELGPLQIAGSSFSESKKLIDRTFRNKIIGVKANISMGSLRSIRVFVLGEAYKPGSYVITSLSTITNALVLSGGISNTGSLRNIQLKRKGKLIQTLDLYDLLLRGDTSNDAQLKSGDVVFIPPVGDTVSVGGEVRRPAIYELRGIQFASEVVEIAGGLTAEAFPKLSTIRRATEKDEYELIELDLDGLLADSLRLENGDDIQIPARLTKTDGLITLSGHFLRPGERNWQEGVRLSDLIPSTEVLELGPDLNFGLIERTVPPTDEIKVLSFSLKNAWSERSGPEDLPIMEKDIIHVFGLREEGRLDVLNSIVLSLRNQASIGSPSRETTIGGSVRTPGTFPLLESMTIADLINAAGGLTERAYELKAELSRTELDESQRKFETRFILDLSKPESMNFALKSRDVLQVKSVPDWATTGSVTLTGEVLFPGTYSITKNDTLSSVLKRAGGLTEFAYIPGAVFSRLELKRQQAQQLEDLQTRLSEDLAKAQLVEANSSSGDSSSGDIAEAQQLLSQLKDTDAVGRLVIDLQKVLDGNGKYEIPLRDGDELSVPTKKNSVTIVGEVQLPISQIYEENLNYWDYINRSGGTTENADEGRIYIIKADGAVEIPQSSNWFASSKIDIHPGDTIVVPLDADKIDQVVLWRDLSQIFYQIALGAAAVGSL